MNYLETVKELRTKREMEPVEISSDLLYEAIECVRYASSAMNRQVIRYALINDQKNDEIFVGTNLPSKHLIPKEQAPSAYIVIGSEKERINDMYYSMDIGIAAQIIREFVHYQGLNSLCIHSFDRLKTKEIIGVSEFYPELLIAIGKSNQKVIIEDSDEEVGYYRDTDNIHTVRKLGADKLIIYK